VADLDRFLPAIAAGDADAFGRWVSGAEPRIRASLASFAATVDTEAVVQEALLRVWQVATKFTQDGRPDGLVRLGVRIARNLAISEVRRARVVPTEADELERRASEHVDAPVQTDPLLREQIRRCLDALPTSPAQALMQRIAARGARHDLELAEAVGMTLNTFLQNIRRARTGLSRCLERAGVSLLGMGAQ
jgi:DNA-directed RNA polymerase specialized sigma24 family protein